MGETNSGTPEDEAAKPPAKPERKKAKLKAEKANPTRGVRKNKYVAFIPSALLAVLAFWPSVVSPMTWFSTFWAFYLSVPLAVIAFLALVAGIAFYRNHSN